MQTLIQDLLTYSRTKTANWNFVKMDLGEIVNEVIEDFEEQIIAKQGIITVGKICTVNIIPFQFRHIMYNLIGNAIKFGKQSEPFNINIFSEPVTNNNIKDVPLLSNTTYCHIAISDNGILFEPHCKEKIF